VVAECFCSFRARVTECCHAPALGASEAGCGAVRTSKVIAGSAHSRGAFPLQGEGRRADGARAPGYGPTGVAARPVRRARPGGGQARALEIAAAGAHSVLMVGPPGAGKSMLAQRLPGLLPPMSDAETLASAALASLAGAVDVAQWKVRPFRSPHHSATAPALVGGGSPPRPGEISLAYGGVLFLDEMPEMPRTARASVA
jgi:magnesium chelatase family protein